MSSAILATMLAVSLAAPEAVPAPETTPEPPPVAPPAPLVAPAPAPEPTPPTIETPVPPSANAAAPEPLGPIEARAREIQQDPELRRRDQAATNLVITGAVGMGIGLGTLLLVSAPAHAAYRNSLEQAEQAAWVTEQAEPIARANQRRRITLVSAGIGVGLTTAGAVFLAVGGSRRARLRRPRDTLSLAPAIGGGQWGVAASMRF